MAARADDGTWRVRGDGWTADERVGLFEVRRVVVVGLATARRGRCGPGETIVGARAHTGRELSTIAAAAWKERRGRVPSALELRDGHDRRRRLRARAHARSRRRIPWLWLVRDDL